MKTAFAVVLFFAVLPGAQAQTAMVGDTGQQRIPTVTRLVQQFMSVEKDLLESARRRDLSALGVTLADDFELRAGALPGVPTPREEWIRQSIKEPAAFTDIEQMSVHDHGNVAVVSFLARRKSGGPLFIVDVWARSQDKWKLATRYASPAGDGKFAIPGLAADAPVIEKRY